MAWGLIISNHIFQIVQTDPANNFNPGLVWVNLAGITPAPQVGWVATLTGSTWTFAPPPPNPNGAFPPPM